MCAWGLRASPHKGSLGGAAQARAVTDQPRRQTPALLISLYEYEKDADKQPQATSCATVLKYEADGSIFVPSSVLLIFSIQKRRVGRQGVLRSA